MRPASFVTGMSIGAVLALGSCTSSTEPREHSSLLRFVSGEGVTDTVQAFLGRPLIVEVHDSSGAPAPIGTVVSFSAMYSQQAGPEAWLQALTTTTYSYFATGTTDAAGRTAVLVRLGTTAGTARVVITVPTLNILDTARFTVKPGAATQALIVPIDTALLVGKSFRLRGGVADQWGNPRPDPVTWSAAGPGISVTSGGVVTTSAVGRFTIAASTPEGPTTSNVSVVPPGRLVGEVSDGNSLVTADMDGANLTTLASVTDDGRGVHPAWIPGTNTVVYATLDNGIKRLYKVDVGGVPQPFFSAALPFVTLQAEPTPTADGKWVYFSAYDSRCVPDDYCLYRSRADGSSPEMLGDVISKSSVSWHPAPSPDGARLAFVVDWGYPYANLVTQIDVPTKTYVSNVVYGDAPAWSPDGTRIAYLAPTGGGIVLMNPDATNPRTIAAGVTTIGGGPLAWSPDSKWIIGRGWETIELVNVATGEVLPLPWAFYLRSASWK
ncbi:MAG TPA: hypothetical protein VGL17_04625 [Gemmatimonadaceae bacterium]